MRRTRAMSALGDADLIPVGAAESTAACGFGGWQAGFATFFDGRHAGLWKGTAASWEDLSRALAGLWIDTIATGVWSDGSTLLVSGYGWNTSAERYEALLWSRPLAAGACRPDLTTTAILGSPGYGTPDGTLNSDDFFYYLTQFAAGNLAVADLTAAAIPGSPGYGVPNGLLNNDDYFAYLTLFASGC